jgi:hypothetical protein
MKRFGYRLLGRVLGTVILLIVALATNGNELCLGLTVLGMILIWVFGW